VGDRDHSIKCAVCGLQRGGLNDYKCYYAEPPLNVAHWQQSSLLTHMTNDGKIRIRQTPDWAGDVAANNVCMDEISAAPPSSQLRREVLLPDAAFEAELRRIRRSCLLGLPLVLALGCTIGWQVGELVQALCRY
jgi:hypothetical protein